MHASGYLKILYAILAIIYIISLPGDCHAYARNDKRVETPTRTNTYSERTYTRYVPIRSASRNGGENMSAELDEKYENAWHSVASPPRKRSGTAFSRFVLPTARLPLVARNELAIVTKSIAFVSPPRTTDNLVENCPYLSGGRKARKGKRGYI